jgi:hypothetical protein
MAARKPVEEAQFHRIMARRSTFYRSKRDIQKHTSSESRRDSGEIRLKAGWMGNESYEKRRVGARAGERNGLGKTDMECISIVMIDLHECHFLW